MKFLIDSNWLFQLYILNANIVCQGCNVKGCFMVEKINAKQSLLLKFLEIDEKRQKNSLNKPGSGLSALALQLLKEGFSQTEVAEVLRINRRTLSDYARKWQLEGLLKDTKNCAECGKEYKSKTKGKYCSIKCKSKQTHNYTMTWLKNNRSLSRQRTNDCRFRLRVAVIVALGGKCVRCEINDHRCLTIDHVNGGGTSERKMFSSEKQFLKTVLSSTLKGEHKYQLLCANHNAIKRYEKHEWRKPKC